MMVVDDDEQLSVKDAGDEWLFHDRTFWVEGLL